MGHKVPGHALLEASVRHIVSHRDDLPERGKLVAERYISHLALRGIAHNSPSDSRDTEGVSGIVTLMLAWKYPAEALSYDRFFWR